MSANYEFVQSFSEFLRVYGWRTTGSAAQLVAQWDAFVSVCADGYGDTIYDYENERSVRDVLAAACEDPVLCQYHEMHTLCDSILEIDARFRAVCRDDVFVGGADDAWWQRAVPKKVYGEFADDLHRLYGIEVV